VFRQPRRFAVIVRLVPDLVVVTLVVGPYWSRHF